MQEGNLLKNKKKKREDIDMAIDKDLLEQLKNSYIMYERTKNDMKLAVKRGVLDEKTYKSRLETIERFESDVIEHFKNSGGDPSELVEIDEAIDRKNIKKHFEKIEIEEGRKVNTSRKKKVKEINVTAKSEKQKKTTKTAKKAEPKKEVNETVSVLGAPPIVSNPEVMITEGSERIASLREGIAERVVRYDYIKLPSNGECYKSKVQQIPVGYLTAYDENIILSPNLYTSNEMLDHLLRNKILTDDITVDEMVQGDKDAVIIWLRATSYGPEYPISPRDENGNEFEAVIDLRELNYKPFKLKGDANGCFEYQLPVSKDILKVRFLNTEDMKNLSRMNEQDDLNTKKKNAVRISEYIKDFTEEEFEDEDLRDRLIDAYEAIAEYADTIEENNTPYIKTMTNKMYLSIESVNGNTDRAYIYNYVNNMNVKDSTQLRVFLVENEPGIDYNLTIEKPKSLGGGSMPIFLEIDQYIFLNVLHS